MKRFLLVINFITLLFCSFQQAFAQSQVVVNGASTTPIILPGPGCIYNWVNNNPAIGLPASGTGIIPSFTAINTGSSPITATITATPVPSGFAYVANSGSNNISVVSTITHSELATIPVGSQPWAVAVSPDATRVYVANSASNSVSVIDATTNSVIKTIPVLKNPIGIAISPDGGRVYVANVNGAGENISIINTSTNTVTGGLSGVSSPFGITVSPDGKWIYVTSASGSFNNLYIFDSSTGTIAHTVPIGFYSTGIVASPDGSKVYVANNADNTVTVVDPLTGGILAIVPVGENPYGITILPDGSQVYVANSTSRNVSVINTATNAVSTIATNVNNFGVSVSADGSEVYVISQNPNVILPDDILVINPVNNTIKTRINAGSSPISIGSFASAGPGCNSTPVTFTITVNNTVPLTPAPVISYQTPQVYDQNKAITPLSPQNTGGAIPAIAYGQITTFAGSGVSGIVDGKGAAASFTNPSGVAVDAAGNVYVADNTVIRKITPDGTATTFAGIPGVAGSTDGSLTTATFRNAMGIAIDKAGNMYVVDASNNNVRKITPGGMVTTLAGDGQHGYQDGPGATARFSLPFGITVDLSGNVYIGDAGNNVIRKITPTGEVSTYAGTTIIGSDNGPAHTATFNTPSGVALDGLGNLYVAEYNNNLIRKITPAGVVSTFAGSGASGSTDGTGTSASFFKPAGVTVDEAGNVYVTDAINSLIRKITPAGVVTTFAGTGSNGHADGIGTQASLSYPTGVATDGGGNLYIADDYNHLIRRGGVAGYSINKTLPAGLTFDRTTGTISGTPTVTSPATNYTVTAYNAGGSSSTVVNITVKAEVILPPKITYVTPQVYPVNVPIAPLAPTNTGGPVSGGFGGNQVTSFAGSGAAGGANGTGTAASFVGLEGITTDAAGNIYVSDFTEQIRKITPAGVVTSVAGLNGTFGYVDGQGTAARFNGPAQIAVDAAGNIYVADDNNNAIRKVTPTGLVTTVAGTGAQGSQDGPGASATFFHPTGLVIDAAGNIYVADFTTSVIRKITPAGVVSTFAGLAGTPGSTNGTGTTARFWGPNYLAIDAAGNLYVSDYNNNMIRKITPAGLVSTLAGSGSAGFANGTGAAASFNGLRGITLDAAGNIYVADEGNNLIRKITPAGVVTTFAGSGARGAANGALLTSSFSAPFGVTIDAAGNFYITDSSNNLIRKISSNAYTIDKDLPAGLNFDTSTGIISGTPTIASAATDYTITAYNAGGNSSFIVNITVEDNANPPILPPAISYQTPQVYTQGDVITPFLPANTGGDVPVKAYGQVSTFANTTFKGPVGVAVDRSGNLYVSEFTSNSIKKVTPAGVVTTLAGNGTKGAANGPGNSASFFAPYGIALDAAGNVYVADEGNQMIRKITPGGLVSTFAGSGAKGSANGTGASASFNSPISVVCDAAGNVYVADRGSSTIRKINPAGVVSTFVVLDGGASPVTDADGFGYLTIDAVGNLYLNDGNRVKKITLGGVVTTIAGSGAPSFINGTGTSAGFNRLVGITFDASGNLYVGDASNNMIRKITPAGVVTTLAGTGLQAYVDGPVTTAAFFAPYGVAIDGAANMYIADAGNNVVRKISLTGYTIDKALPSGLTFDPATGAISGTPTVPSSATDYTITAYNAGGSSSTIVNIAVSPIVIPIQLPPPPKISYQTPQVYPIFKTIDPLAPTNTGGAVPASVYGEVTTFSRGGGPGSSTGSSTAAGYKQPYGIAIDAQGNVYVAEQVNNLIRKITPAGVVTTLAGNTTAGSNNGTGTAASFNFSSGVTVDAVGNVYVADHGNNLVRKITPAGVVTTLAGGGPGTATDGQGTQASFFGPMGISIDKDGNLYVAEDFNDLIRKITPSGLVTTLAGKAGVQGPTNGQGAAARFFQPGGTATDNQGNIYVADQNNNNIRKITPGGLVSTYAGSGVRGSNDGTGTSAGFMGPTGVAVDAIGNVYVADEANNTIRKITPAGVVTTLAGLAGAVGANDGTGPIARFNFPSGVAVDKPSGDVYVTDQVNGLIRKIVTTGYTIDKLLPSGMVFNPTTGIISGTPIVTSPPTDYIVTAYNAGGSSSTVVNISVVAPPLLPQVITLATPSISKTYGDADFDGGINSNNNTIPVTLTSSNPQVAFISDEGKIRINGVGITTITASQEGNGTYSPATPVELQLTVNPAKLTITADNKTKNFGDENPVLTITYTGFVYQDGPLQLITQPEISTTATTTSPVGEYPITVNNGGSINYVFIYVPGILTINAVQHAISIPNTFTPNGDGINDVWNIKSISDYPECTVSIYTRYGGLVYHSKGYPAPWDGTFNGSQLPVGTYYYIIDTKSGTREQAGYVTIIR